MSKAYKCDRCGCYFDNKKTMYCGRIHVEADFCPECVQSFEKWLKMEELHITSVKKHQPVVDLEEMRDATQEESEGVNQYIESISKETDANFNDFLPEQPL